MLFSQGRPPSQCKRLRRRETSRSIMRQQRISFFLSPNIHLILFWGMFIISLINCSFKRAWALLQHDYWDQVDYIPTSLACSWFWGPDDTNMFWGWNNLICQLFNQKSHHSGLTWTRSPLHHEWLLWCTSRPTEATGRNYNNAHRSLHRERLQYCWKRHITTWTLENSTPLQRRTGSGVTNGLASGVKLTPKENVWERKNDREQEVNSVKLDCRCV